MARHHLGARALTIGAAAVLLGPIALAVPAGAGQTQGSHGLDLRGRTGLVLSGRAKAPSGTVASSARKAVGSVQARTTAPRSAVSGRTAARTLGSLSLSSAAVDGDSSSLSTQAAPQAVAGTCADGTIDVNPMVDRTVVRATSPINGALTIQRQREYGSWRTIATGSGTTLKVNDTTVNENVSYQYRLLAKNGTDPDVDCTTEFMYGMWTRDGAGDPDAVVAGTTGIFQQGMFSVGSRAVANEYQSPRYSTDGRLYAATRVIDDAAGRAVLEVRRSSNSALVFTVDLGTSAFPADPDFSPDGQTIAYTRYAAGTGQSLGLGFVDVFGAHTRTVLSPSTRVGEPSWRPDGASLVVSTFGVPTPGLAVVTKATGVVTPLSGTAGGYTADVAPDGTILFAWTASDNSSSALRRKATSGAVSDVRTSTTDFFISPRLTPDGTLYVERDTPDVADPTSYSMAVHHVDPVNALDDEITAVGLEFEDTLINGWDVRQPQSKGTSDFTAEAHHDVVARDASGNLFAYRNTGNQLSGRVQIGSGWKSYTAVLAAGDLTGDDQADLVGRDANGALWLYRGKPTGGFLARTALGTGWNSYTLVAPGDWNGDGRADIVARDGAGTLWLYPGTGRGTLAARVKLGTGWGGLTIIGPGDIDFDNRADLMTRDSAGRLFVYPGNGTGGFLARRQIGSGFGQFNAMTMTEVTWHRPMLWVRTTAGELVSFEIRGDGVFSPGDVYSIGTGWGSFTLTS